MANPALERNVRCVRAPQHWGVKRRKEFVAIYAVFGVGVGNLGRGRAPRRLMAQWVEMLNRHLSQRHLSVRIVDFFGHTGNFLADSVSTLEEVTARFKRLCDTDWVVRPNDEVRAALTALAGACEPEDEHGIRWTLGLAFHGGTGTTCGTVATTPRAVLWQISPCTIGVWKRDNLDADETLDRDRRSGDWGAISNDIERQLEGLWTARSRRTIDGLIRKAETAKWYGVSTPV